MQGPFPVTLPHTPGIDVAGTVEEAGEGVDNVAAGDRVIGFLPMVEPGAVAEYAIAPAEILAPAPTGIPLADAAPCPRSASPPGRRSSSSPGSPPANGCWSTARTEPSAATRSSRPSGPTPT